jgi:hypothetical protein
MRESYGEKQEKNERNGGEVGVLLWKSKWTLLLRPPRTKPGGRGHASTTEAHPSCVGKEMDTKRAQVIYFLPACEVKPDGARSDD